MLLAVVDKARHGGVRTVKAAFESVEQRYADLGRRLRRPVTAEIVTMPIMGASKSLKDGHTLFISVQAVESGFVDGLIAHEVGHMLRTEEGHPSHDPQMYEEISREVHIPKAAEGAFGQAFNHLQDVYADDLAFPVFSDRDGGRSRRFFAGWVENNLRSRGTDRWQNVGLAASNGFAIGTLVRHDLIRGDDKLWDMARAFDRDAGFRTVEDFAALYSGLPNGPSPSDFLGIVQRLAGLMTKAAA